MPLKISKPEGSVGKASQFDKHLVSTPAVGKVHAEKVVKQNGAEHNQTLLDTTETVHPGVVLATEELCKVTVEGGQTFNMGNYESARIAISLTMPCKKDEVEETYNFCTDWISNKMEQAAKQIKE